MSLEERTLAILFWLSLDHVKKESTGAKPFQVSSTASMLPS